MCTFLLVNPFPSQTEGAERLDADGKVAEAVGNIRVQFGIRAGVRAVLYTHHPDSAAGVAAAVVVVYHIEGIYQAFVVEAGSPQRDGMCRPVFPLIDNEQYTLTGRQSLLDDGIEAVACQFVAYVFFSQSPGAQLGTEETCGRVNGIGIIYPIVEDTVEEPVDGFQRIVACIGEMVLVQLEDFAVQHVGRYGCRAGIGFDGFGLFVLFQPPV